MTMIIDVHSEHGSFTKRHRFFHGYSFSRRSTGAAADRAAVPRRAAPAASLVSLLGAVFFVSHHDSLFRFTQSLALLAGVVGVGGLVSGSALLVWETRLTLRILSEETAYMLRQSQARFDRT